MRISDLSKILIELLNSESAQSDENNRLVLNNMLATLQAIATVNGIVNGDPLDDEYKQDMIKVSEEFEKFFVESTIERLKDYGVIVNDPKLKRVSRQNVGDSFQMGMNYGYGMPYLGYPLPYATSPEIGNGAPSQADYPKKNTYSPPQQNPYLYQGQPITPNDTEDDIDRLVKNQQEKEAKNQQEKEVKNQPFIYQPKEETEKTNKDSKQEALSESMGGEFSFDFSKKTSDGESDKIATGRDYLLSILEKRNTNKN